MAKSLFGPTDRLDIVLGIPKEITTGKRDQCWVVPRGNVGSKQTWRRATTFHMDQNAVRHRHGPTNSRAGWKRGIRDTRGFSNPLPHLASPPADSPAGTAGSSGAGRGCSSPEMQPGSRKRQEQLPLAWFMSKKRATHCN